ncbi:hypothetical protein ACRRTK_024896 [Alexandromys fortis]
MDFEVFWVTVDTRRKRRRRRKSEEEEEEEEGEEEEEEEEEESSGATVDINWYQEYHPWMLRIDAFVGTPRAMGCASAVDQLWHDIGKDNQGCGYEETEITEFTNLTTPVPKGTGGSMSLTSSSTWLTKAHDKRARSHQGRDMGCACLVGDPERELENAVTADPILH